MAKMFCTLEEAMEKLGWTEDQVKEAVRDGDLREFRDGGKVNYKSDEIDKLAAAAEASDGPAALSDADMGLSASIGPISLADSDENPMPDLSSSGSLSLTDIGGLTGTGLDLGGSATDAGGPGGTSFDLSASSGINLASGGEDMISFDDEAEEAEGTSGGTKKDDTVVSSVGISVFDEEDLDESADPMAKTIMSSTASGTGLEGVGSGSGLLDLTRESDDTSLGAELLDEIYPGEEGTVEMGEDTRAGLEGIMPDETPTVAENAEVFEPAAAAVATPDVPIRARAATGDGTTDPFSGGVTALVAISMVVMCLSGLAMASMIRGVWPPVLSFVFSKLWMFGLGAVVAGGIATGTAIFLGKRSAS